MKLTQPGRDILSVTEEDYENNEVTNTNNDKVHLIKFDFQEPDKQKIDWVMQSYPSTNRFVIDSDIKIYNDILRVTPKKYYVENKENVGLVSFFRKNNKCLLNFLNLLKEERDFFLDYLLFDLLKNLEIVVLDETNIKNYYQTLKKWSGNVVVYNPEYEI